MIAAAEKTNKKAMFSHSSDEWHTPQWLFDVLNKEFHFKLDAAATKKNALVKDFYSKENDGLKSPWPKDAWTFCNPPYSLCAEFAEKAMKEAEGGGLVCFAGSRSRRDALVLQFRTRPSASALLSGSRPFFGERIGPVSVSRSGIRQGAEYRGSLQKVI